jgi:hypothetical protein
MHPMARDMLDRLLAAGRAQADPARRRMVLDDAVHGIPRAFYGLLLNGIPDPKPGTVEHDAAQALFLRWAWTTPDYAVVWAATSPPGPFRSEALAEGAGRWACRFPDRAAQWARSLAPDDRRLVFANAVHFMTKASPSAIEAWQHAAHSDT